MQFIRPYLNLKKGNSQPGNLPSPTHDNDNDQGASSSQDNYNNTDLCNNITITEEISSTNTNNIVENKVVGIKPPLKKKKNSNNITSVDECVIDYIKAKQLSLLCQKRCTLGILHFAFIFYSYEFKTKVFVNFRQKKIIEAVESGKKKNDVADSFQIPSSTLSTTLKQKDTIFNTTDAESNRKKNRQSEFSRLEQCLYTWFNQVKHQNIPVSGILVKEKAKSFAEMLGISNFTTSYDWLFNFKKRHNLVFRKICGESASVDEGICDDWKAKLQDLLCEYDPKNVFNADETGLFFKCLPDRTLTYKNEKCHGDNNDFPKVTILTAITMSHKAWNNVTGQTIRNCFRTCGFVKAIDREEDEALATLEVDSQWHRLSTVSVEQLSTFEEFVAINDDLAICGVLNDEEILNKANDEKGNDEKECCEDPPVNSKKAKSGLRAVLNYLQRHDIDGNVFRNILNFEKT
ncbi:hypothetical protein QTP88_003322 [Uroleucon formosanum]